VATWPRSLALEACGGAPRSFHHSFAAGEDLLHSLVDAHAGIMRDMTNRACALGAWWFQSHLAPFSCESGTRFKTRIQLARSAEKARVCGPSLCHWTAWGC
jgi:hypothetical protein